MTVVGSSYLEGNFAPVTEEVTARRSAGHRHDPRVVARALPAQRTEPGRAGRSGDLSLVHAATAWCTASGCATARPSGTATVGCAPAECRPRSACRIPAARSTRGMDFAANTNVIGHAGKTLAIVEAGGRPIELSYELDTVRRGDFDGTLPNGYTAHPKLDPDTGELHAVCYWWGLGNQVQYIVVDAAGKVTKVVPIETTGAPMLHDMGLSSGHVIVLDLPCVFNLELATSGAFPYKWDPSYPARVGVLPRSGDNSDVKWFEIDPCYVFHPMNTFDDGDRVVFDAVRHPGCSRPAPRPRRRRADARPLDVRPVERQGRRGASRRSRAGVPASRRAARRQAVPLRLHRARRCPGLARRGQREARPARRDAARSTTTAQGATPRSRCSSRRPRLGRGRRVRHDARLRLDDRSQRPRDPARAGLHRRARGDGAPAAAGAVRLPRQLGARPRLTVADRIAAARGSAHGTSGGCRFRAGGRSRSPRRATAGPLDRDEYHG